MNPTNYVEMFETNVKSRLKDLHFYEKNKNSKDFKPTSILLGAIIGAIICKVAKL